MLRHLLGVGVGFSFSSKNDGEGPKIAMADDFAEMFLGKEPGGSDPAFDHVGIAPAGHVMRSLLNTALRTLNNVEWYSDRLKAMWRAPPECRAPVCSRSDPHRRR
jgi:hypothetical protein